MKKLTLVASAAMLCASASFAADDGLIVLDWSGYEETGFFQAYIDKHGDNPAFSFFGEEEEAFQNTTSTLTTSSSFTAAASTAAGRVRDREAAVAAGAVTSISRSSEQRWQRVEEQEEMQEEDSEMVRRRTYKPPPPSGPQGKQHMVAAGPTSLVGSTNGQVDTIDIRR